MKYNIPSPRVISEYGKSPRRIIPVRASASLAKTPLSTASIELPAGETVSERAWIEMFTCTGSIGVFRVSGTRTAYGGKAGSISLEHGAAEIGDYLVTAKIPDPDNDQDTGERTVSAAFTTIFSYYGGTMWSLGTVAASGNVTLNLDGENVLEAMLAVMEQLPGYYIAFDQTTTPWTVSVLQMPTAISAEGRLSRNVESAVITTDTSDQCNRLYMDGLPSPGYVQDTASITRYGVIARYQSGGGDDLDAAGTTKLVQEATKYVNAHKEPRRTIQISGRDFSAVTGESLDALQLCKLYRLALPDYGVTVDDNIISLTWRDIYNDPDGVDIVLDEEEETIDTTFSRIKKETLSSTGRTAKNQKQQQQEIDEHWKHVVEVTDQGMEDCFGVIGVKLDAQHKPIKDGQGYVWAGPSDSPAEIWNHLHRNAWSNQILNHIKDANGNIISLAEVYTDAYGSVLINAINDQRTGAATINADKININTTQGSAIKLSDRIDITSGSYLRLNGTVIVNGRLDVFGNYPVSAREFYVGIGGKVSFQGSQQQEYALTADNLPGTITALQFVEDQNNAGHYILQKKTLFSSASWTNEANFNIAATQFYQDAVAAAYASGSSSGSSSVTISNSDIVRDGADDYNPSTHNTTIYIEATASNGAQGTQSFVVSGADAYNAGLADGGTHDIRIRADERFDTKPNWVDAEIFEDSGDYEDLRDKKTGYYVFKVTCGTAEKWYCFHVGNT